MKTISPLFLAVVALPTALSVIYFGLLADDVYLSESRFIVRTPGQASVSPLNALVRQSGLGGGGGPESTATVSEYVLSRRALEDANTDGFITKAYTDSDIFFLDRFGGFGGASQEQLYRYFLDKVIVNEALSGQTMTITVKAFDPEEAQKINARLLEQSEELVNSLTERSRSDTVSLAEQDVEVAKEKARDAAIALAQFRDGQGIVDPEEQSQVGLQMIGKLQDQLIAARTQLRQLQTYTPKASQIPFLRTQIRALEGEIAETRQSLAGGRASLSASMVRYQELRLASEFAEQQLAVSLASLETALVEARRKRAYVERIADPSLPDYAEEPRRIRSIFATLVMGLLAWGVLSMLMIGVREHRD